MSYSIRPATLDDGAAILALLHRTPQDGLLRLNFERDPDFFLGAYVTSEFPDVWVAQEIDSPGRVAAVFNIGVRTVYVNGEPQRIRYAHDLRIDPGARGGLLLHRLFRQLRRELLPGEWMQTVILDGNEASLGTVGSGRAGLPVYYPCGDIETSLVFTASRPRLRLVDGISVRRADAQDIERMQAFLDREAATRQFFPRHDLRRLLAEDRYYAGLTAASFLLAFADGGRRLVGMAGDWDQAAFRKTRVLAYPGAMRWLRHGYNAVATLAGGMRLPAAGECFHYRSLHTVAVQGGDPAVFGALLERALADNHDCDALACGFFTTDPLAAAVKRYRRRVLRSRHFLVSYDGDPRPSLDAALLPYVDIARL